MKIFKSKIKGIVKRLKQYISFSILLVFIFMGSWCLPPKWIENVIQELKSKYTVENVLEDEK
jgi:thiol-disulfide isomerase/thioredoxin